jgi:hypothetical protein
MRWYRPSNKTEGCDLPRRPRLRVISIRCSASRSLGVRLPPRAQTWHRSCGSGELGIKQQWFALFDDRQAWHTICGIGPRKMTIRDLVFDAECWRIMDHVSTMFVQRLGSQPITCLSFSVMFFVGMVVFLGSCLGGGEIEIARDPHDKKQKNRP